MIRAAALALALIAPAAQADPRATGAEMPEVQEPNVIRDALGGAVAVATVNAPQGFADQLRDTDRAGLLTCIDDIAGACPDPGMLVIFVADWVQADDMAASIGLPGLAQDYADARARGLPIHYSRQGPADDPVFIVTIPSDLAPADFAPVCWARSIVATIYENGSPAQFRIGACYEALRT